MGNVAIKATEIGAIKLFEYTFNEICGQELVWARIGKLVVAKEVFRIVQENAKWSTGCVTVISGALVIWVLWSDKTKYGPTYFATDVGGFVGQSISLYGVHERGRLADEITRKIALPYQIQDRSAAHKALDEVLELRDELRWWNKDLIQLLAIGSWIFTIPLAISYYSSAWETVKHDKKIDEKKRMSTFFQDPKVWLVSVHIGSGLLFAGSMWWPLKVQTSFSLD